MSLTHCPNFKLILHCLHEDERWIIRARCKMWSCEYCCEKNRDIWRARIIDHINNTDLQWSWFTLTAHSKKRSPQQSLENLRNAFDALLKRFRRKFKHVEKIHYVRVFEQHKNKAYHLHCIISVHFDDIRVRTSKNGQKTSYSAWLKKSAVDLKLGYYTHAANFDGQHAGYIAGYVTKYMTKFAPVAGCKVRHIQTSQGWPDMRQESGYQWHLQDCYSLIDWKKDQHYGIEAVDLQTGEKINSDHFLDSYIYPPDNRT